MASPQFDDAGTLTDNKQLHHRGCGKAMHHGSSDLVTLLNIPLSSALHTSCYSIAYVIPIICICQRTLLVFEGLLCKTMKKTSATSVWHLEQFKEKINPSLFHGPCMWGLSACSLSATRLHRIQQPKVFCWPKKYSDGRIAFMNLRWHWYNSNHLKETLRYR